MITSLDLHTFNQKIESTKLKRLHYLAAQPPNKISLYPHQLPHCLAQVTLLLLQEEQES